jgi:anti-sigma factor RsiW
MSERNIHPETALVPYVREELAPAERARVATHLEGCDRCRVALADVRAVLGALASAPAPSEPHWGRYRAELRARLAGRSRPPRWWQRPMPIALSAGLAAALLLFTLKPTPVEKPATNLTQLEETTLGARLDMLEHYDVVSRLDMLDAMDEIRQLDVVPVGGR